MASLKVVSDRCDDNSHKIAVVIPPRRNGGPNLAALDRVMHALYEIRPDAFDADEPAAAVIAHADGHTADGAGIIPPDLAHAMLRDGVIAFTDEEPPLRACPTGNCE